MPGLSETGENKAWSILEASDPEHVCRNAGVAFDPESECYLVRSYGMEFAVSFRDKSIASQSPGSDLLLQRLVSFFRLSMVWYLASAKDIPSSHKLVRIEQVRGGGAFARGSHVLPLDKLAAKYGADRAGFLERGTALGGEEVTLADAAVRLHPFPRIPVVATLWLGDAEFPPRAGVLFDSTCEHHLPTDIVWSIAMLTILVM